RGYSSEELDAVKALNKGNIVSNSANQLGRFAPSSPMALGLHLAAGAGPAVVSGGASIVPQAIAGALLYGAKKLGEKMTLNQAKALAEEFAKRSPLYQQRVRALPPIDIAPNVGA